MPEQWVNLFLRTLSFLRNPIATDLKSKTESKAAPKEVALNGGWGSGGVQLGKLFCGTNGFAAGGLTVESTTRQRANSNATVRTPSTQLKPLRMLYICS